LCERVRNTRISASNELSKRQSNNSSLKAFAPSGSLVEVPENGFIVSECFVKWLNHFVNHVKPTTENKALHFPNGHAMHLKNLEAVELARKHGVIRLQLLAMHPIAFKL
jgi:hypothetical protein